MTPPLLVGALTTTIVSALAAGGPQVPDQPKRFPSAVEEVVVDVVVDDRNGTPRTSCWPRTVCRRRS
jgi:hypothetical protein